MNILQETLVNEIHRLRKARRMDQQALATAVGIGRSSISNIERGRQAVTLSLFCKIASALGKNPGELLNHVLLKSDTIGEVSAKDLAKHNGKNTTVLTTINNVISKKAV